MQNSQKVKYNLAVGILSQILSIVLGILLPKLILTSYGSEINGLITSVTQIYTYIALLEAGVGTAAVQALYKTIGADDKQGTNAVLAAAHRFYRKAGCLYLAAIAAFAVLYPFLVKTDIPTAAVMIIIVVNGLGNVAAFFFHGKYMLLLQADGKNYIRSGLETAIKFATNIAKIILIRMGFNVIAVQTSAMFISFAQMIYISGYIRKNYRWIDLTVTPDWAAISQSKNVLVHQLSFLIFNNTDTIILSIFSGLKTVSVYSLYTLLFSTISMALSMISESIQFLLGQAFHKDRESFIRYHDCFELFFLALAFCLYSVANFFILPFMACYTRGITDINYVDPKLPLLFMATFVLNCGRIPSSQVITFAEHFRQTQNRTIAEAVINLTVSLIAVRYFGIYGVLMGTIAALLYRSNDMILYANRVILRRSAWTSYRRWGINLICICITLYVNTLLPMELTGYGQIALWVVPYGLGSAVLFFGAAILSEPKTARFAWELVRTHFLSR